jgi:acyl carrier protein
MDDIESRVLSIFTTTYEGSALNIDNSTRISDLPLDSLDTLEILAMIEENFEVEIESEVFLMCKDVGSVISQIREHVRD